MMFDKGAAPPVCPSESPVSPPLVSSRMTTLRDAEVYLTLLQQESPSQTEEQHRLPLVREEIQRTGTYWQTSDEVASGAKVAWRNSTRCIGRLHWQSLIVRDRRHLATAEDLFHALVEHLRVATRGGKIQPTITVFAPQAPEQEGIRLWNAQLIRYAGYQHSDGTIVGDPQQVAFTKAVRRMGWTGGTQGPFDVLPLVIHMPGHLPQLFDLPSDVVLEVPLRHPDFSWFAELGVRWHAVPVISNMRLEIGGISYPAAPFNGWYMGTEIGRNLGDEDRYHLLPTIAQKMGLNMKKNRSLWRDQALVELNKAVLFSYDEQGVTMVDHHTASRQFVCHQEREERAGRETSGDWGWLVPPLSGSLSPIFHRSYHNDALTPNFWYQDPPWKEWSKIQ